MLSWTSITSINEKTVRVYIQKSDQGQAERPLVIYIIHYILMYIILNYIKLYNKSY